MITRTFLRKWCRAKTSKRRNQLIQRTPKWLKKEDLKAVYDQCPRRLSVDHIIPLSNPIVSGLNVPWNLQYLTISQNVQKGNSF